MKECPACKRCFPDDINHCPQDGDATTPSLLGEPILDARYQLERRLGQGGMGVVFQARHIFLKTQHAIKVILPDLVGNDPMLVTRFRQEALAAAAIRHQNIIAVTDFGVVRGTMPFLVMEFLNGRSLHEIMGKERAMPAARAFELICPIASGVGAAHRQNIVHRDLKPLNIMIQDNMPASEGLKILDFGLAKIKSGELLGSFVQAKTSGLMGSPFYMAPEQWSDEEPDSRADIYSLGIILYQMLAGEVPFKGSSIPSIMKKHLTLPPPTISSFGVQVPPEIEAVVRHALEKEIATRTPSVDAFLNELREAVNLASAGLRTTGDRGTSTNHAIDFNRTAAIPAVPAQPTSPVPRRTGYETNYDPNAGVISSADVDQPLKSFPDIDETTRIELEAKERFAREELKREEEARRRAEEAAARTRKEQEDRERKHQEQIERVARQAEALEEKLARLTTNVSTHTSPGLEQAVIDPEATQVQSQQIGNNSFPGGATTGWQRTGVLAPEQQRRSPALLIGLAVVLVVLLAGGGVGAYLLLRPTPGPPVTPGKTDPGRPGNPNNPPIKAELIEIPGGTFKMGRDHGPPEETPAHDVKVATFFMDKTEVTNAEYADFVRDTNHAPPEGWTGTKPALGLEQWPIVGVSLDDAKAFADWRSKRDGLSYRLPTEQEWEYAARNGERSDLYPWGNDWKDKLAVLDDAVLSPVASHPNGNNRWGVSDLLGNAWEWTSSKVTSYPGNKTTVPEGTREWIAIRGGGFSTQTTNKDSPVSSCMRSFITPTNKNPLLGFRLVRSAP